MRGPAAPYILFELVGVSTIRHRAVSNHHFPLQFATMDKIHREMLGKMTSKIMGRISSPRVFSGHLREIFSAADVEEIAAREAQMGPTHGTQTMLSLLEKRGPKAYGLFLKVLQDPQNCLEDLADELENEERKLRGKTGIPFLDLFTLNTIEINLKLQSRHYSLFVGPRPPGLRRIPSFSQTTPIHKKKLLDSYQNIF